MKNKLWNKNFILLLLGQNTSILGNELHYMALIFWLKSSTNSTILLGTLMSITSLILILTSFFSGVLADRYSRKLIIIISDFFSGILVLVIAFLALTNKLLPWHILIITPFLSYSSGLLRTSLQSMYPDLVHKDLLMRANSINEGTTRMSQIVAPALAGWIYHIFSISVLFFINAFTFLFSAIMELFIEVPKQAIKKKNNTHFWKDVKLGLNLVRDNKSLKYVLIYTALTNIFGAPLIIILPRYLEDNLHASTFVTSIIFSAKPIGALLALSITGFISNKKHLYWRLFFITSIGTWIIIGLCGIFINSYYVSIAYLLVGAFSVITITILGTVLQLFIPSENRGKFFGLFGAISMAITPISMFIIGVIGQYLYIPYFYIIAGSFNILILIYILNIKDEFKQIFEI